MRLYQLCYRVGGAFEGALFIEASSLGAALWEAERAGLHLGDDCDGIELHPDDARLIPREFIGRVLGQDELVEFERVLLANMHKRPPAPSIRRRRPARARF